MVKRIAPLMIALSLLSAAIPALAAVERTVLFEKFSNTR